LVGAIAGSLFYVIGFPLLPLALGNYLMPLNLTNMGFTTLVDIIPVFVNSFSFVFLSTLAIGALVGLISSIIYGQGHKYIKNRIQTRVKLNEK
jgi:preprotein translocase subunit SecF